ncbi:MAG TPA: hypothetical protein VIA18_28255 [Polyangia bacterium]|jgi:hypothetical protein|nr:hypothetical protein [Polyangia bacterium]
MPLKRDPLKRLSPEDAAELDRLLVDIALLVNDIDQAEFKVEPTRATTK